METGINTIRKVVAIIGGTLAIILMVFSLCKKVGLCAEPGAEFPLPFGLDSGYGFTEEQQAVLSGLDFPALMELTNETRNNQSPHGYNTAGLHDWTSAENFQIALYHTDYTLTSNSEYITENTKITIGSSSSSSTITAIIRYKDGTWDYWYGNTWGASINIGAHVTNGVVNKNELISNYPIYSTETEITDTNGITLFSNNTSNHTKGGILAEIIENDEIAENELPQIDTEPPTDTTTNAGWFFKLLAGMGKIQTAIQSQTITTGNYLEQILTGQRDFKTDILALLGGGIPGIVQKIDDLIGYNRQQAQEQSPEQNKIDWLNGYNQSFVKEIKDTGDSIKTNLGRIGQTNTGRLNFGVWRLEYNGNHLHLIGNYNIPNIFGGGTHQQDISFEWYENVKSYVMRYFKVFLYVGFAWYLITQVPAWINGSSSQFRKESKEK